MATKMVLHLDFRLVGIQSCEFRYAYSLLPGWMMMLAGRALGSVQGPTAFASLLPRFASLLIAGAVAFGTFIAGRLH
jgi:hypothetical protein